MEGNRRSLAISVTQDGVTQFEGAGISTTTELSTEEGVNLTRAASAEISGVAVTDAADDVAGASSSLTEIGAEFEMGSFKGGLAKGLIGTAVNCAIQDYTDDVENDLFNKSGNEAISMLRQNQKFLQNLEQNKKGKVLEAQTN